MPSYLIVPGWRGSGVGHWQTCWAQSLAGAARLVVQSWEEPDPREWHDALDAAIAAAPTPPILVAHSLGCVVVARWAARTARPVRGALLVAPPDLERSDCPRALHGFAPEPRARLPFAARVIASDNDPYAAPARSHQLAGAWGAPLTMLQGAGHINGESGFGPWLEGQRWLAELTGTTRAARPHAAEHA